MKEIIDCLEAKRQVELAKNLIESKGYKVDRKSLQEQESQNMTLTINITPQSTNLTDEEDERLYELSANGLELSPISEEFPMPWDAGCFIEDGFFVIDGDFGQQGSHRGWAKCGIPLDRVKNYLDITIYANDQESYSEIQEILGSHNWL